MVLVTHCKFSRTYVQMSKVLILLILNAFRILKRHFFWGFSSPPKLAGKYIFIPRFNCIPRKSSVCFKITYLTTNQNLFFNFQTQYIPEKNCSLFRFEKCSIQCTFFFALFSQVIRSQLRTKSIKSEVVLLKNETTVFKITDIKS